MKYKVAVSSRIVQTKEYVELRDAISHDLVKYIYSQSALPIIIPNSVSSPEKYLDKMDMLILSGGNDISTEIKLDNDNFEISLIRDNIEFKLVEKAIELKIPKDS